NKFLYRESPNPGLNEIGYEHSGIIANRNLDEWKINRQFFVKTLMSKTFLRNITEKTYRTALDMFKLWDILINDQREINLSEWFTRHAPGVNYFNNMLINRIKELDVFLHEIIQERCVEIDSLPKDALLPSDFLTLLLTAKTSRCSENALYKSLSRSLNNYQIFGIIKDIFLGSFETTATVMCSVIYFLCKYPSVKSKALSEIDLIFGHSTAPLNLHYEDVEKLQYCDALIKEVLRIKSTFPVLTRSNSEPVEVGGYLWKEEQSFFLNYEGINLNENDWIDSKTFDPDRFLKDDGSKRSMNAKVANAKGAFSAFGGGAKSCPGRLWAIIEIKVILVAVLMRYEIEFVNKDQELDMFCDVSYHWRELKVRLKPKKQKE
ncbi:10900_t:CDS:2, partial [Scutellospora calospora]